MLGSRFCVRSVPGVGSVTDHANGITRSSTPHSLAFEFSPSLLHPPLLLTRRFRPKSILISCNSSRGPSHTRSNFGDHHNNEYLEASLLLSGLFQANNQHET